jgi:DNA adenine methylase
MPEIKSPLRYPGGKSFLLRTICPLIGDFDEYREPFVGGGSVFMHLKHENPGKYFVINDRFKNLYLFWKFAQSNNDALVDEIVSLKLRFPDGKELWNFVRGRSKYSSDFAKAVDFFIINRISFSGVSYSGGYSEGAFNGRFTESSIERVSNLKEILDDRVSINNFDYSELLRMPAKTENSKVVVYCDPPYFIRWENLYGKNGNFHFHFNHKRFANMMKGCKHRWIISYNDCDEVRELFSFANIITFDHCYSMRQQNGNKKTSRELLITNFKTN